jgi:acyl carrier protein phosphodiesterase
MNFLAHIYLSGENDHIKIGNFMADSIRGHSYENYLMILKGILLHRSIDSFTDMHPVYRKSKHRLHEKYGHYSGVIMDIFMIIWQKTGTTILKFSSNLCRNFLPSFAS